ncbi:MAG TPA: F0F1 ATP synthase subunit B [Tepidisphaeraceae bacterium]|nr:F0F1 ATP synthase subunit B [Tepidisphaeraceae bacterium]
MKRTRTITALTGLMALALLGFAPMALAADPKGGPEAGHGNAAQGHGITKAGEGPATTGGHGGDSHGGEHHDPALIGGFSEGLVVSITTLLVFALLMAILGKYAWGPIAAGLKAREERIRKDIADAEAARAKAEATLREYSAQLASAETRVREMLTKATADGEAIAAGIRTRAQQESEETKERAMREIEGARTQAVAQLHEEAAVLATAVAEKILRRNLSAEDQRDLVAQSLDELQSVGVGNGRGRRQS